MRDALIGLMALGCAPAYHTVRESHITYLETGGVVLVRPEDASRFACRDGQLLVCDAMVGRLDGVLIDPAFCRGRRSRTRITIDRACESIEL